MKAVPSCAEVITGGVLSMLIPLTVVLAPLPGRSIANPVIDWFLPSFVRTTSGVHETIPERVSLHSKCTVTSTLFHPFALGPGDREPLMVGGVLSMLISVTVFETVLPAPSVQ